MSKDIGKIGLTTYIAQIRSDTGAGHPCYLLCIQNLRLICKELMIENIFGFFLIKRYIDRLQKQTTKI